MAVRFCDVHHHPGDQALGGVRWRRRAVRLEPRLAAHFLPGSTTATQVETTRPGSELPHCPPRDSQSSRPFRLRHGLSEANEEIEGDAEDPVDHDYVEQ